MIGEITTDNAIIVLNKIDMIPPDEREVEWHSYIALPCVCVCACMLSLAHSSLRWARRVSQRGE